MEPGAYLREKAGGHPGRDANPPQGHSHTKDNLETPISLQCMSLHWGRKPEEVSGGNPRNMGEHANATDAGQRRDSNPQPYRCEADMLTTKPPSPRVTSFVTLMNVFS